MPPTPSSLLPEDEAERLLSLRAHEVLPSLLEPVFDEFVALTARIFSLPISLIAVVEEEEVYYAANYGMAGHDQQAREEALCATAILQDKVVVYHDLLLGEYPNLTSEAVQAAQQKQLRFYAGAPLRLPDQRKVGTLCVIDRETRLFTAAEQQLLEQIAALISQTIVVRHRLLKLSGQGEAQWQLLRGQLQEGAQELTALVRYLFTRYGVQVPVPADLLTQVARRLEDLVYLLHHPLG